MRPVIQMTSFMRAIGFALSPQISKPFLGQDLQESNITNINTASTSTGEPGPPRVQFAYWIMSVLDFVMVVVCMSVFAGSQVLRDAGDDKYELISDSRGRQLNNEGTLKPNNRRSSSYDSVHRLVVFRCILLSVIFLLLIMYGGISVQFFLLYTYLYEYLGWSVDASTLLITLSHTIRFVFGAIVAVISRWLSPTWLTVINLVIFFQSSVLMLLGSLGWGDAYTVIGVILMSITACNMYPTTITLTDETIPVTAPVMTLFISTIEWSLVVLGPLSGALLHKTGAVALPSTLLACSLTAALLFLMYFILTRATSVVHKHVYLNESSNEISLSDSSDELRL